MNQFLRLLFGAGLLLTEPRRREKVRSRIEERFDDLSDSASKKYEDVVDRLERASRVVRGGSDWPVARVTGFLAGMGVGVGLGLLFAPASGEDTRAAIAGKVQSFEDNVRVRATRETRQATGTE